MSRLKTSRWWDALWALWVGAAVVVSVLGIRDALIPLAISFFLLELPGIRSRVDPYLPLTLELQSRSPGWLTFALLGAGMWRLSDWVPSLFVFVLASWLVWHFIKTYGEQDHIVLEYLSNKTSARLMPPKKKD